MMSAPSSFWHIARRSACRGAVHARPHQAGDRDPLAADILDDVGDHPDRRRDLDLPLRDVAPAEAALPQAARRPRRMIPLRNRAEARTDALTERRRSTDCFVIVHFPFGTLPR
jgi:hypothetical protein